MRRLVQFHATSLILAVALIGSAWFYKKHLALPEDRAGFPGYFTFLVAGALIPAVIFFPVARRFINWRALSLTLFFMLLVSLLWETTLAVPYGWWSFQHRQMIGLFIGAWSRLPIEEVCVWIAVTYATVIVFEVVKIRLVSERSVRDALLGATEPEKLP
jgi:lycopene cyclase domain-containing protein